MAHDACMSNTPFPFKVGDKVRLPWWETGEFVTITAVGVSNFLASDAGSVESDYPQRGVTWFRLAKVAA